MTRGYRTTLIALGLLATACIVLAIPGYFVPALDDNVAFSIPGDYHDRYVHGLPFGFWMSYVDPEWMEPDLNWWTRLELRVDLRGLFLDAVFWGFLALLCSVPAGLAFVRQRNQSASNQAVKATS